jgi:hypothetical protein
MKISSCKKKKLPYLAIYKRQPPLQTQEVERFFLVALLELGFIEEFFFTTQ